MRYFLKILVFTVIVIFITWITVTVIFGREFMIPYLVSAIYFLSATILFHKFLLKYLNSPQRFITVYMAGTGLKLLITLGIIISYFFYTKYKNDEMNIFLVISFVCYHLLFLAFESVVLFGMSRSSK